MVAVVRVMRGLIVAGLLGQAAFAQQDSSSTDIIVKGKRETLRVDGGAWQFTLSPPVKLGLPDAGEVSPPAKTWRFCLRDVEVESLVRLLVGETHSNSASIYCSSIRLRLGKGKVSADQRCSGGNISTGRSDQVRAFNNLTIWGTYSNTAVLLEFVNFREAEVVQDPDVPTRPERIRWSVAGTRLGSCPISRRPGAAPKP